MQRRVLQIIESFVRNGVTSQALSLSHGLKERGFEVYVAGLGVESSTRADFAAAGIGTSVLKRRCRFDPVAAWQLRRLVQRWKPDILHTWNADAGWYGGLVARGTGKLQMVHGQYRIEAWRSGLGWKLERRRLTGDCRLVSNCEVVARWWAKGLGIGPSRVSVVAPGVRPSPNDGTSREQLLRELELPVNAKLIGVVGRLAPEKRVKDLIWAADLLRVLHNDLRLLVIGDGPQRKSLHQYAIMASDLDHIQFLGERDDARRIMRHLDVLWNADEGRAIPIAILESLEAGVPVVAGDTPVSREVIVASDVGYLVPLLERSGRADRARATDQIFSDSALARRLADRGKQEVEKRFDQDRMVRSYEELYA